MDTSSQVSAHNDSEMEDASLGEIPTPSSWTVQDLGGDAPPPDMAHLWEEANKALGDLLVIKSPIDAHQWKLISEFSMALCQNDSEATESAKEAKAICNHSFQEAETHCSRAIREVEAQRASQAGSIQQSHYKAIQHLKEESIEERKGQLNFLSVCQTTFQGNPPEFRGMLVASCHILLGHAPTSHHISTSPEASPYQPGSTPGTSSPPMPELSPRPNWQCHSPDLMDALPLSGTASKATPKGPHTLKQWEITPLYKALTRSHLEAFNQDSSLVRETGEEYFWSHCPNFNNENTYDFTDIFWNMIATADVLGSTIYKITEAGSGQDELW